MTMGHLFDHGVFKDFEVLEVRMGKHLWIAQTGHALIEGPSVRTWELRVRGVASKVRERQRRKLSATATWPQGRKRDGMRPTVGAGGGQRGGPHAAPRPRGVRAWPSAGQRGLHRGTATRGGQPEAFAGRGLRAPEAGFGSAREQRGRRGRSCLRAESRTRGVDRRSGLHPAAARRERWAVERSIPGSWQGSAPIRGTRRSPWRKDAHEALPTCRPPVRTRRDGRGIGAREPVGPG